MFERKLKLPNEIVCNTPGTLKYRMFVILAILTDIKVRLNIFLVSTHIHVAFIKYGYNIEIRYRDMSYLIAWSVVIAVLYIQYCIIVLTQLLSHDALFSHSIYSSIYSYALILLFSF